MADQPLVLGFETSCDETGVGLVRGHTLLADALATSMAEHERFGGVVPEIASRAHLEAMVPTVHRALADAGVSRRRRRRGRRHLRARADRRAAGRGRGRQGLRAGARQAAVRRQPPRRARRRRRAPARAAGRALDRAAGLRRAQLAAAGARPRPGRRVAGPHRRRRGGGGLRQGRPRARACRSRAARRSTRRRATAIRGHRLPARAHRSPRRALRLLLLRPEDRRRPLGRGARSGPASRCRWPTSRRRSRRRWPTC